MKRGLVFCGLIAAGLFAIASSANANQLAPGGSGAPDILSPDQSNFPGNVVADTTVTAWNSGAANGTYQELVYRDVNNVYCNSCLDFMFAVSNDAPAGSDALRRLTLASFTGFLTDVGLASGFVYGACGSDTVVGPATVDKSLNGSVVGFNWDLATPIGPGDCTPVLVIETDTVNWTTGTLALIDGQTLNLNGFAPSPIPGPIAGAGLPGLILACGGLIGLARRRRRALALTA